MSTANLGHLVAANTGFRAGGLAMLTPACFRLDPDGPAVTLPIRADKSKRGKVQPLRPDVAEMLRGSNSRRDNGMSLELKRRNMLPVLCLRIRKTEAALRNVCENPITAAATPCLQTSCVKHDIFNSIDARCLQARSCEMAAQDNLSVS